MRKSYSYIGLIVLNFAILSLAGIVTTFLIITIAFSLSGGVSFFGVPTGIIGAIWMVGILYVIIIFPLLLFLTVKLFRKFIQLFSLPNIHILIVVIISGLILTSPVTSLFVGSGISEAKTGLANREFKVSARIVDEKIEQKIIPWGEDRTLTENVYRYTIAIDNQTNREQKVAIGVLPGDSVEDTLFDDPGGNTFNVRLQPGENLIQGEYEVSRDFSELPMPASGKIPISIFFTNHGGDLYKEIFVYSSLDSWEEIFQ